MSTSRNLDLTIKDTQANLQRHVWHDDYHSIDYTLAGKKRVGIWTEVDPEEYGFVFSGMPGSRKYLGVCSRKTPSKIEINTYLLQKWEALSRKGFAPAPQKKAEIEREALRRKHKSVVTKCQRCGMVEKVAL